MCASLRNKGGKLDVALSAIVQSFLFALLFLQAVTSKELEILDLQSRRLAKSDMQRCLGPFCTGESVQP